MNRLIKILLLFSINNFLFPQFGKNKVQRLRDVFNKKFSVDKIDDPLEPCVAPPK